MATEPEKVIYYALKKRGIDFEFQSKMMGGRDTKGGAVVDFYIPSYGIIINVQGEYWHLNRPGTEERDRLQQLALEGQGIKVIYIGAEDALRNADFYVSEALNGISHWRSP